MLWSATYLESRLPRPLPTKDGGTLYAVKDVRAYVLGLPDSRSEHLYWQRAHQLLLDQTDVVTLRRQIERCSATPSSTSRRWIRHDRSPPTCLESLCRREELGRSRNRCRRRNCRPHCEDGHAGRPA